MSAPPRLDPVNSQAPALRARPSRQGRARACAPRSSVADRIRQIVQRHYADNPRVFGSTARGEDAIDSDIDILVDMKPQMSIFSLLDIQDELEALLGTDVDVVVDSVTIPTDSRARISREALVL